MMEIKKKRRWGLILVAAVLLITGMAPADNMEAKERTVRVAYPIQSKLTDVDENGIYSGYTYEYLEEIAQYTGWNYEFVQVPGTVDESLTTLLEMLERGEVDLMGGMLYTEDMKERYDYSGHGYGVSETVLQVPYESTQNHLIINSQIPQGMRISVLNTASRSIDELEDYCKMNLITPEYIPCKSVEEQVQAVREGRADAMLNAGLNYVEGVYTIASFASKPFYFITTKGKNSGLMEELNGALNSINQSDPTFSTALYEKYFSSPNDTLILSNDEKKYIEQSETLKVGVLKGQQPFQYIDDETGTMKGIAVDLLSKFSEETGLTFEFVGFDTQEQMIQAAQKDGIRLVAGVTYNYKMAREQNLSMSRPYLSSEYILMMNAGQREEQMEGKKLAVFPGSPYQEDFPGQTMEFDTIAECVKAVKNGEADFTYVDAYAAQYYINTPEYKDLKLSPQYDEPRKICFGLVKPADKELLSILNKAVTTITDVDMQAVINRNTLQQPKFSISYYIKENPVEAIVAMAVVFLLVIAGLLAVMRQRMKMTKKANLDLKKHFRVYALLDEYFFEYNFATEVLLVSNPPKGENGKTSLEEYHYQKHFPDETMDQAREEFFCIVRSGEDGIRELKLLCEDGRYHWLRIALETIYDGEVPVYSIGKINIIDEEREEKERLREKAQMDSLTHIYNSETTRNLVEHRLQNLKEQQNGAMLLVDIDHFKSINDTHGHLKGDAALSTVAQMLRGLFREEDVVGRIGGDEFLVYMENVKSEENLRNKCESVCRKANELLLETGEKLTISLGAAMSTEGDRYEELYQRVDQALYAAKKAGRNTFRLASPTDPE